MSVTWTNHNWLTHSPTIGCLGCFQLFIITHLHGSGQLCMYTQLIVQLLGCRGKDQKCQTKSMDVLRKLINITTLFARKFPKKEMVLKIGGQKVGTFFRLLVNVTKWLVRNISPVPPPPAPVWMPCLCASANTKQYVCWHNVTLLLFALLWPLERLSTLFFPPNVYWPLMFAFYYVLCPFIHGHLFKNWFMWVLGKLRVLTICLWYWLQILCPVVCLLTLLVFFNHTGIFCFSVAQICQTFPLWFLPQLWSLESLLPDQLVREFPGEGCNGQKCPSLGCVDWTCSLGPVQGHFLRLCCGVAGGGATSGFWVGRWHMGGAAIRFCLQDNDWILERLISRRTMWNLFW